jgi:hypothetical protein
MLVEPTAQLLSLHPRRLSRLALGLQPSDVAYRFPLSFRDANSYRLLTNMLAASLRTHNAGYTSVM